MVDDKSMAPAPDEESDVDQINQFVASSDNTVEEKHSIEGIADNPEEEIIEEKAGKKIQTIGQTKKDDKSKNNDDKNNHRKENMNHKDNKKEDIDKKPEPEQKKILHKTSSAIKKILPQKQKIEKKTMKPTLSPKKQVKHVKEDIFKESREKKKRPAKNILLWIGIGVLAAALIVALILLILHGTSSGKQQPATNQTNNTVAATVNGEAIYLQDIERQYNNLNPLYQQLYTIESLLNKSIDDMLLLQDAKNSGIKINPEIVQNELDNVMVQNAMTEDQLEQALAEQGMTVDSAKKLIENSLMIRELLNNTILQNITVTDTQMNNYYELNIEQFKVPEKVTVRHILVMTSENVTEDEAKAKIEMVKSELNDTNFCELALKYSDDPGSKNNCGEYTFAMGDFNNPEFENPSFNMSIGETAIAKTIFGYHLIKKIATIPSRTQNLSEVYSTINETLYNQAAQKKFDTLIGELKAKATIINYYTKASSDNSTIVTPVKNLDNFAKCLTENNATFYGASWCTHCQNQKEMFGDSLKYVKYVECAAEGNAQTKECTDAGISGYPTWIINGQQYPGEQSLENLARLTGCSLG